MSLRIATLAISLALAAPLTAQQNNLSIDAIASAPFPYDMVAAPADPRVAWVYNERGARNIWVAEPAGADRYASHRLTRYTGDEGLDISDIGWTGDGRYLVYRRGGDDGGRVAVNPMNRAEGPVAGSIWAIASTGGDPVKLADGYAPLPSPSGQSVAFLRGDQPFIVAIGEDKPRPLFVDRGKVSGLRWSPDGRRIAFVSERTSHSLIGVFDLQSQSVTWVAPDAALDIMPVWSPDGSRLAFIRTPAGRRGPYGTNRTGQPWSLWVADAATGAGKAIWTARAGSGSVFRELINSDSLLWAENDRLVFPWEGTGWVRLHAIAASGGQPVALTPDRADVFAAQVGPGGRIVYASNQDDIDRRHIWSVAADGSAAQRLSQGGGVEDFPVVTSDGRTLAVAGGARTPLRPMLLTPKGMTDIAPGTIPADFPTNRLVTPELVTFRAADGLIVHGQLFVPNNLKGKKAPALLFSHGGPTNRQAFAAWDPFETHTHLYEANQYFAANGYVVLSINYRGGSGYGLDFREAENFGPSGSSELNDIVGAARFLQQRAEVDPGRMGVWGGSYGGHMAALAMARAPEYWVAGVDYAGVHDMTQTYAPRLRTPEEVKRAYAASAISDLSRWKAPVLLMAGDADRLAPQTVELATALRARDIPVETIIIPNEVHFLLRHDSWNRTFEATKAFLDRHLKP